MPKNRLAAKDSRVTISVASNTRSGIKYQRSEAGAEVARIVSRLPERHRRLSLVPSGNKRRQGPSPDCARGKRVRSPFAEKRRDPELRLNQRLSRRIAREAHQFRVDAGAIGVRPGCGQTLAELQDFFFAGTAAANFRTATGCGHLGAPPGMLELWRRSLTGRPHCDRT